MLRHLKFGTSHTCCYALMTLAEIAKHINFSYHLKLAVSGFQLVGNSTNLVIYWIFGNHLQLCDNVMHDISMDICQPKITSLISVSQLLMV